MFSYSRKLKEMLPKQHIHIKLINDVLLRSFLYDTIDFFSFDYSSFLQIFMQITKSSSYIQETLDNRRKDTHFTSFN